jgi:hypothetical protein
MERKGEGGRQRGFFVSFGYTQDTEHECASFHGSTVFDPEAQARRGLAEVERTR